MNKIKNKATLILLLIVVVGSILRLWQLGSVPPSLDWDEVALGYNAYSIFETGKDEFSKTFPVVLRSFDDYKPALYAYLIIPTYKIFGLNEFAVRLPSAVFGIISIVSVYYLVRKLFKQESFALLSAFILAISPWHIQFSRIAFESNVGLSLNILAVTFFIYGLRRHWFLLLSALCAGLSIHVYQSEKVFTPLMMIGVALIYFLHVMKLPRKIIITILIVGFLVVLPLIIYIISDSNSLLRAKGTSIFNDNTVILEDAVKRGEFNEKSGNIIGKVLDNRRIVYAKTIISGYLSHYNPNWLLNGDIARHHAPEMGLIYIWEFPFILIGIYSLIFMKFDKRAKYLIFFWFFLAPVPASITTGVPHAVRTLNFLPTWQIFTAIGLITAYGFINQFKQIYFNIKLSKVLYGIFVAFFLFNFLYYLNQYFVQQNYFHSKDWQYGYRQMVSEVMSREDNYSKVVISDMSPMDKSYMFFLFFSAYPPEKYQQSEPVSGNFITHQKFDKYEFRPINWKEDSLLEDTLFVGLPSEIPMPEAEETIYYLNGEPAMVIVGR